MRVPDKPAQATQQNYKDDKAQPESSLKYKKILQKAEEVLSRDSRNSDALFVKATALAALGEPSKAIDALNELAKMDHKYPGLWLLKAKIYEELGEDEKAMLCYGRATQMQIEEEKSESRKTESIKKPTPVGLSDLPGASARREVSTQERMLATKVSRQPAGVGRPHTSATAFTNGLGGFKQGMVNGLAQPSGMVNGLATENRKVGMTNGLSSEFRNVRLGITNGLTNGNGFTNGLGSTRFKREAVTHKWKLLSMCGIAASLLLIPLFTPLALQKGPPFTKTIDGDFEDWDGTHVYVQSWGNMSENIDITGVSLAEDAGGIELLVEVRGQMLAGGPDPPGLMDAVYVFVDLDGIVGTGYSIKGIGADRLIEIQGQAGKVATAVIWRAAMSFVDNRDWRIWIEPLAAHAASAGGRLEIAVEWSLIGGAAQSSIFLVGTRGYDRSTDFSDIKIGFNRVHLMVEQQSIAPTIISGPEVPLLAVSLTAVDAAATVSSIRIQLKGTAPASTVERLSVVNELGTVIATQIPFSNPTTLTFSVFSVAPSSTETIIIEATVSSSTGETLGVVIPDSSSVDAGGALVTLETTSTLEQLGYLGCIPSVPTIDGAFADWTNESGRGGGGGPAGGNPSIEIDRFGTTFRGGEMMFHVRLLGTAFAGTVLTTNPRQHLEGQQSEPDSDGDTVPDGQDMYPYDFNNDGFADADSHEDVDGDGLTDWNRGGSDRWLNTTIPVNFPVLYAGNIVSWYIGPIDEPPKIGEDQLRLFIDSDNNSATGYFMEGLGSDYMVEMKGREGAISKAVLFNHGGINPGDWKWNQVSNPLFASGLMQFEARVDLTPMVQSPSMYLEMSDWGGRKTTSVRGTRGGEVVEASSESLDSTFIRNSQGLFAYRSSSSRLEAYLRGSRGDGEELLMREGDLLLGWRTTAIAGSDGEIIRPSNVSASVADNDYVIGGFAGAWEQYVIGEDRIKHNLWLLSPLGIQGERMSLEGDLRIPQGTRVLVEEQPKIGSFVTQKAIVFDLNGRRIRLEPPFAYESRNPENRVSGEFIAETKGTTMHLSMTIPGEWLRNPLREYPVVLDPTGIIDTTTSAAAVGGPSQRNVFYDGVNFWAFYYDGSTIVYEPSSDGLSWVNTKSNAFTTASVTKVSTWYHDTGSTKIVYVVGDTATATNSVRVRRGTISGTTITWGTESGVTISDETLASKTPFITRDSSGYIWIGSGSQPSANSETWYVRSSTGVACGAGDRESQSLTAGSSAVTKTLDAIGDTWNRQESAARTIIAGTWTIYFDVTTEGGSGAQNKVGVRVQRMDSSCILQQTIINTNVNVDKGVTQEYSASASPGDVAFSANDMLTVTFLDAGGNQLKTLRYNNTSGTDADTRLNHPNSRRYGYAVARSTNTDDVGTWGSYSVLSGQTLNNFVQGVILPQGSGEMYALWYLDGAIKGKKFSGTWGSEESIDTTSAGVLSRAPSAVVDGSYNVHLAYVDSSGAVKYRSRTSSWGSATDLDTPAGNLYATITLDTSGGDLYGFWIASDNQIKSKKYSGGSWTTVSLETNTNSKSLLTSVYSASATARVAWMWRQGAASPYDVKFSVLTSSLKSRTVDTSTISTALRYGHQRKMFFDGTYFWIFYEDGNELIYTYSSDGLTWENARSVAFTSATRNQASIWYYDGSPDVVYAVADGVGTTSSIPVRRGTISGSTISWGTEASATVSTVTVVNQWPFICRSSDNYLWIVTNAQPSSGNWNVAMVRSSNADDVSSWSSITYLMNSDIASTYVYAGVVPLSGGNVYAYWYANGTIAGKKYSGSWGSQESIASTSSSTDAKLPSAVVDGSSNVHMVYSDVNGRINYTSRTDASSSWSSPSTISSGTGNTHPTITRETSTGDLYVFWVDSSYQIRGARYSGSSWSDITDIDSSTITKVDITSPYSVTTTSYLSYGYDHGGSSPYEVKFALYTIIPEFGDMEVSIALIASAMVTLAAKRSTSKRGRK